MPANKRPLSTSQAAQDARRVVTHPNEYADDPRIRALAWAILASLRGKPVRQNRKERSE